MSNRHNRRRLETVEAVRLGEDIMEIGFLGMAVIVGIFLIWFWNSLYIIK
jgi:hypothetical protein